MSNCTIDIPLPAIQKFCEKWQISRMALFGSACGESISENSDVDVLISFLNTATPSLIDHYYMQDELSSIFARPVDLITSRALERHGSVTRRNSILQSLEVIYEAACQNILGRHS